MDDFVCIDEMHYPGKGFTNYLMNTSWFRHKSMGKSPGVPFYRGKK